MLKAQQRKDLQMDRRLLYLHQHGKSPQLSHRERNPDCDTLRQVRSHRLAMSDLFTPLLQCYVPTRLHPFA